MNTLETLRSLEADHAPDGWPAVQMKQISALCDEVERLRASTPPAAQPFTALEIETLAHRKAWRYKHSTDPNHSNTYTFNRTTLIEFTRAATAGRAA